MKQPASLIYTDGICIYISVKVTNPLVGKVVLVLANLMVLFPVILGITEGILAMTLAFGAFFLILLKYTLWNFWGRENIIVNTKSVSYQHEYGVFKTNYTTKSLFGRLLIEYFDNKKEPGCVNCRFISYSEITDVPFEIYTMVFPLSQKDVDKLRTYLDKLFIDHLSDGLGMPHISLN